MATIDRPGARGRDLDVIAKCWGLKRRFFGWESDRSLQRRVREAVFGKARGIATKKGSKR